MKTTKRIIISAIALTTLNIGFKTLTCRADSWTQKSNFPGLPRTGATGLSIGNKAYMGLGKTTGNVGFKDWWEYNPASDAWSPKATYGMPVDPNAETRNNAAGFAINGKAYIGPGYYSVWNWYNGYGVVDLLEYNPATNTWTQKGNFLGTPRVYAVGFAIGNKGYIGCGLTDPNSFIFLKDFWEYNSSWWTQMPAAGNTGRRSGVGFAIGSKGYVGCGYDGFKRLNDFWEFNPANNQWTQLADAGGGPRDFAVGFAIGNKGYIGIGTDGFLNKKDLWEYNPATNTWTQKTDFGGSARWDAVGFSIGCKGYIGTGKDSTGGRNDFWEYTPDSCSIVTETNEASVEHPKVILYPNPASGKLYITSLTADNMVEIWDMQGKRISIECTSGAQLIINVSGYKSGTYLVIVRNEKTKDVLHIQKTVKY